MAIEQQQQLQTDQGLQESQASQDQLPSDMCPRSEPLPSEESKDLGTYEPESLEDEDDSEDLEDDYEDDSEEDYEDEDLEGDLTLDFIFDVVAEEYSENGYISDDTHEALIQAGFPEEMINTYFNGLQAIQEQKEAEVFNIVGSPEQYRSLTNWALHNLPKEDIDAFDSVIDSNDMSSIRLAVEGLMSRYEAQEGSLDANTLQGYTNGSGGNSSYSTVEEWMKDATDPRYKVDANYRDRVEKKYLRSRGTIGVANLDG